MASDTGAPWNLPYPEDTDLVKDGAADIEALAEAVADGLDAAGGVKQVVTVTKDDTFSTTSTTYVVPTDLEVTITPSSTSSRILLIGTLTGNLSSTTRVGFMSLFRGTTNLAVPDSPGSRTPAFLELILGDGANQPQNLFLYTATIVDSPGVATAVTYSIRVSTSSGGTAFVNRSISDADTDTVGRGVSTLTAIEVAV